MKTILVPIDFSEASLNALSFAAELAKRASADLIIFHATSESEENVKARLGAVTADLKRTFGAELRVGEQLVQGSLLDGLKKINPHPDLIVMGTKGASGLKRVLIGSNTVNVIAKTSVPVLVIPEEARFEHFNNKNKNRIVLAADLDSLQNEDGLEILKQIALLIIEPKVRVLNVRPKNTVLLEMTEMERRALLSFFNPEIQSEKVTVFSSNVINGINLYLDKHPDTGLVAMIARDSGELIQRHYTHEMASHTHLPLLVLHDVKN